jgi:hypothetical protein
VRIAIFEDIATMLPRAQLLRSETMKSSPRTVDLVITGDNGAALAASVGAVRRGRRVLVVLRPGDTRTVRRFRRCLRRAVNADDSHLAVMTNAEVVCVDGVFLSFDERDELLKGAVQAPARATSWRRFGGGVPQDPRPGP